MTTPPVAQQPEEEQGPTLTPLVLPEGHVLGQYASFNVSPSPMYGPDELGDYKGAIDDLDETVTRADSAGRTYEVMQAWEARQFAENRQFLIAGRGGWSLYGAMNGSRASGGEIFQTQNAGKLFSCNVYGARQDKIVAALSREVPGFTFVPKRDKDPMDQTAADEAKRYLSVWMQEAGIKNVVGKTAALFYTDDRVVLYTRSVADQQAWGTESPDQHDAFGEASADGVTPETEMQAQTSGTELPAVRELTSAFGKLEAKVPLMADSLSEMGWVQIETEQNVNTLRERYAWIEDKITAGGKNGKEDIDRQARINVRLCVQSTQTSGESWQQDTTETLRWYRPSQYRAIKNAETRKLFRETFPDGLHVVRVGGELAVVWNESMDKHIRVLHPRHGSGQNRRAIGSNYLPLQKVLNANISLVDRYFRSAVPRRFAMEGPLDVQAMNQQQNDPARVTPVAGDSIPSGLGLDGITAIEKTPTPNATMIQFVQWLIEGAPEVMDGASPAIFGTGESEPQPIKDEAERIAGSE